MEYLAVWTDENFYDASATHSFSLDLECHYDPTSENVFRLELPDHFSLKEGAAFYIDGTEWGGIVRERQSDTRSRKITWIGTTWQGQWAEKVLEPPEGQAYNTISGTVAEAIQDLITRLGLGGLYYVGTCPEENVSHTYTRYPYGWKALLEVLASVSMRPVFSTVQDEGKLKVMVGAVSSTRDEISGASDMGMLAKLRPANHIIGLGTGQGTERVVIHRYADENGTISDTQTFFGLEDRTIRYDSPDSEYDELLERVTETLKNEQSTSEISLYARSTELGIGDKVTAFDPRIGEAVSGTITECVVKASKAKLVCTIGTE